MLSYNELKAGALFIKDGQPYEVLEYAFIRMQQRKPVAQLKIKNLITGKVQNYTAHQNESFEEVEIEILPVKFIYKHQGRLPAGRQEYWFTPLVTGHPKAAGAVPSAGRSLTGLNEIGKPSARFFLTNEVVGEAGQYLKQNTEIKAFKFKNKIINIELPIKTNLKVTEAPPAVRGDTAQGGTKAVVLETGAKINVPLFINEGDIVKVNTQTGEYVERVEKS
jgi:elongation factor P